MRWAGLIHIALILTMTACFVRLAPVSVYADSIRLLGDWEYTLSNSETTEKSDHSKTETEQKTFSQLYTLDVQKEIFPTLKLNGGGLFEKDDSPYTKVRPFLDLQFTTPMVNASLGYRKSEEKTDNIADHDFGEEFSANLNWDPVDLPEVDLIYTRSLSHDELLTRDQQNDSYQLKSRYSYEDIRVTYRHAASDALDKIDKSETRSTFDSGTLRFSRSYREGQVSLNSSLRGNLQQVEFSGPGERRVNTTSIGTSIGTRDDNFPATSDPDDSFDLSAIDLFVNAPGPVEQFSFGLDFSTPTTVDTLLVNFDALNGHRSGEFAWQIFIRNNMTDVWQEIIPVVDETDVAEEQFVLSFQQIRTRFIKVVTRQEIANNEELIVRNLIAQRALPPDTSAFKSTDWTADMSVDWKITDKTTTGYDILYREQQSDPFDERRTQLNLGASLQHQFNDTFIGTMQAQRSQTRNRGENASLNHSYSAALRAQYLDTFDQSLVYSLSHQRDEDGQINISNAFFLRSNLDLYDGWSMFLDNGYSWQDPAEGNGTTTTFMRASSNVVPNPWMNLTLSYGVSWAKERSKPESRDQDGRLLFTWVPTTSVSVSADLSYKDTTGEDKDFTADQRYSINWSPFRNGDLSLSISYGQSQDNDDEKTWSLTPSLRWKVNRPTLLTLDYSIGEREDPAEVVEFESIRLSLRMFY